MRELHLADSHQMTGLTPEYTHWSGIQQSWVCGGWGVRRVKSPGLSIGGQAAWLEQIVLMQSVPLKAPYIWRGPDGHMIKGNKRSTKCQHVLSTHLPSVESEVFFLFLISFILCVITLISLRRSKKITDPFMQ